MHELLKDEQQCECVRAESAGGTRVSIPWKTSLKPFQIFSIDDTFANIRGITYSLQVLVIQQLAVVGQDGEESISSFLLVLGLFRLGALGALGAAQAQAPLGVLHCDNLVVR